MYNLSKIVRELATKEQCINFAIENELIPGSYECRIHRTQEIEFGPNQNVSSFVCSEKGTWFENAQVSMLRIYHVMYCYGRLWSHERVVYEDPEKGVVNGLIAMETVSDWYDKCRETIVLYQLDQQENTGKIGGPGKVVQIDETKFGKRKYDKGRTIEGCWVLGLIEDGKEDYRVEVCSDADIRSAEVLVRLIQKHVALGTTIQTDCWRVYDCLGQHGYVHIRVNHSDPDNSLIAQDGTNTQQIKSQWKVVKKLFENRYCDDPGTFGGMVNNFFRNKYTHPGSYGDVVFEYLWRRSVKKNKRDPFVELIKAIKYVHKL